MIQKGTNKPREFKQEITWYSAEEAVPSRSDYYIIIDSWGDGPLHAYWNGISREWSQEQSSPKVLDVQFFSEFRALKELVKEAQERKIENALHERGK